MILAALLIMLLPHQGYWFGGESQKVTVRWPTKEDAGGGFPGI